MNNAQLMEWRHRLLELVLLVCPWLYGRLAGHHASPVRLALRHAVLVVDHDFPDPASDAGSRAIASFSALVRKTGREVVFWSASRQPSPAGCRYLAAAGVLTLSRSQTGHLAHWLAAHPGCFSAVVVSRPLVAAMYLPALQRHHTGQVLYYGHDIHHRRLAELQQVHGGSLAVWWEGLLARRFEHRAWRGADRVVYPAGGEVEQVNHWRCAQGLPPNAHRFPLWFDLPGPGTGRDPSLREGLLFVGSHAHAPNRDGLDWFLEVVHPRLPARWQRVPVVVVGKGMASYVPPAGSRAPLQVLGQVDDATLVSCYARTRVVLAPLRFGAGVKGKVIESLSHGVPCVLTPVAAQGLDGIADSVPVAEEAGLYAHAVARLLEDDEHWRLVSDSAIAYYRDAFDCQHWQEVLEALLSDPH